MNDQPHFVHRYYFYNCLDCGCELWTEKDRQTGLCLHCLEVHLHVRVVKMQTLVVNPPTSTAKWN